MSTPVGVLAVQGDFALHCGLLSRQGIETREVRCGEDLDGLAGLVLPGGESTTIAMAIEREGLAPLIGDLAARSVPILGTCAGMVLLSRSHLGLLDIDVERNSYGRQVRSFECDIEVELLGAPPVRAVFIRAPRIVSCGAGVERLAVFEDSPVFVRQGSVSAASFHPELVGDPRIHLRALERRGSGVGVQPVG